VVYGVEGIALPIPLFVRVRLGKGPPVEGLPDPWLQWFQEISKTLCGEIFLPVGSEGDLPPGAGLGSSAAFTVASLRALPHPPEEPEQLIALADEGEKIFHGNPSGLDVRTVVYRKPIRFQRRKGTLFLEPLPAPTTPFWLTLWITPKGPPTREMVERVGKALQKRGEESTLREAERIVASALKAFLSGDLDLLGEQLTAFHRWLRELSVSTPLLDELVELALRNGALGAKVTGAGGGGTLLALWRTAPPFIPLPAGVYGFGPWEFGSALMG